MKRSVSIALSSVCVLVSATIAVLTSRSLAQPAETRLSGHLCAWGPACLDSLRRASNRRRKSARRSPRSRRSSRREDR